MAGMPVLDGIRLDGFGVFQDLARIDETLRRVARGGTLGQQGVPHSTRSGGAGTFGAHSTCWLAGTSHLVAMSSLTSSTFILGSTSIGIVFPDETLMTSFSTMSEGERAKKLAGEAASLTCRERPRARSQASTF